MFGTNILNRVNRIFHHMCFKNYYDWFLMFLTLVRLHDDLDLNCFFNHILNIRLSTNKNNKQTKKQQCLWNTNSMIIFSLSLGLDRYNISHVSFEWICPNAAMHVSTAEICLEFVLSFFIISFNINFKDIFNTILKKKEMKNLMACTQIISSMMLKMLYRTLLKTV